MKVKIRLWIATIPQAESRNDGVVKFSVCKVMDYGKYKFELSKKEKENRKNQRVINIKEVQLSPSIDTNDFQNKYL